MSEQVILEIQTNDGPNIIERRFASNMSIENLKNRLEVITGASAATMELTFYDIAGNYIASAEDSKIIADFLAPGAEQRLQLRVKDVNVIRIDDLSAVDKYEMPEEEYNKRQESLRAFKMRNQLGRFSSNNATAADCDESIDHIHVGDRCEVTVKDLPPRRGCVMYVGKLANKPGTFVGVRYDEPCGKNDGSFENKRYFECPPNYGSFVRPKDVKVGDYPEIDIDFDE